MNSEQRPNQFVELDGAKLELWGFSVSHARLRLIASGLARGNAELYFSFLRYIDCPTTMHDARFSKSSETEAKLFRRSLTPSEADIFRQDDLVKIISSEGVFFIWGLESGFAWVDSPDEAYLNQLLSSSLWQDGPPLEQL